MNADFSQFHKSYVQTLQQLQHSISQLGDTTSTVLMNNALQQATQLSTLHTNQMERQKKELTTAFQTQMNARKEVHDEEFVKLQEHYDNVVNAKSTEIEKLKQQKKRNGPNCRKKITKFTIYA